MITSKTFVLGLLALAAFAYIPGTVHAQTMSTSSVQSLLNTQTAQLQSELAQLRTSLGSVATPPHIIVGQNTGALAGWFTAGVATSVKTNTPSSNATAPTPIVVPNTSHSLTCVPITATNLVPGATDATTNGQVSLLQKYLAANPAFYPSGKITGVYDAATEAGVEAVQRFYGIASSGTPTTTGYGAVGPTTRSVFNACVTHQRVFQHPELNTTTLVPSSTTHTQTNNGSTSSINTQASVAASGQNITSVSTSIPNRYTVFVPASISLSTASSTVTSMGLHVLFGLTYLHALEVQMTSTQAANSKGNPNILSVVQDQLVFEDAAVAGNGVANTAGSAVGNASVRVAIVDSGAHGQIVLQTYLQACGGTCADPNPIYIDDAGPDGTISAATQTNAVKEALGLGATIVNLSQTTASVPPLGDGDSPLTADDVQEVSPDYASMLSDLVSNNAILVVAAGNTSTYNQFFNDISVDAGGSNVVVVGGLDPNDPSEIDSRYSPYADIFAPDTVGALSGTSLAAPYVTALLAQQEAAIGTGDINQAIQNVASDPSVQTQDTVSDSNTSDIAPPADPDESGNGWYYEGDTTDSTNNTTDKTPGNGTAASDGGASEFGDGLVSPVLSAPVPGDQSYTAPVGPDMGDVGGGGGSTYLCDGTGYCELDAAILPIQNQVAQIASELTSFFGK